MTSGPTATKRNGELLDPATDPAFGEKKRLDEIAS